MAAVLVTGGAGYIGAHAAKALHEAGHVPVVYDNLSAGFREAARWGALVEGDIRDAAALGEALSRHGVAAVIHFAGLIEVGRSNAEPDLFHDVNVVGTETLLDAMARQGVGRLVFASSAAVYGPDPGVLAEEALKAPASVYGRTKLAAERLIEARCRSGGLTAAALRYFNAAGADPGGLIGEAHAPETHLIPLAIAAAEGRGPPLTVFGADFPTPDGSCLRDYVHVSDLARAHLAAVTADLSGGAFEAVNLGAGRGHSVFEVLEAVGRAVGRPVPWVRGARRTGDPASLVADAARARTLLEWSAPRSDLGMIVQDALRWARNPAYGRGG